MKKLKSLPVFIVMAMLFIIGCKKENTLQTSSQEHETILADKFGSSVMSLDEFEIALGESLNLTATKTNPNDPSVADFETVMCRVANCKVAMKGDGTSEISRKEQQRVINEVRQEALQKARERCEQIKDRVLAFAVKKFPAPAGTGIKHIDIEVAALIACRTSAPPPPCTFSSSLQWAPSALGPLSPTGPPSFSISNLGYAVGDIEQVLNDPGCGFVPPASCPPQAIPPGGSPLFSFTDRCNTTGSVSDLNNPPNACVIWSSPVITPPTAGNYPQSTLSTTELNQALTNASVFANAQAGNCVCQGPNAGQIAYYDVRAVFEFTNSGCNVVNAFCPIRRELFVTVYYKCCGPCQ